METNELTWALCRIGQVTGSHFDGEKIRDIFQRKEPSISTGVWLTEMFQKYGLGRASQIIHLTKLDLPAICLHSKKWMIVKDIAPNGGILCESQSGNPKMLHPDELTEIFKIEYKAAASGRLTFRDTLTAALKRNKAIFLEIAIASVCLQAISLGAALFSMQVYDRVIPTAGLDTLWVLSAGLIIAVLLEWAMKNARASVMSGISASVDEGLSRSIFSRLLTTKIDSLPQSVGGLASQLRGYEQVRAYYTSTTLFSLVDLPIGIIFIWVMYLIGTPGIAAIPTMAACIALIAGYIAQRNTKNHAKLGVQCSSRKTGLLVEVLEGAETIKSSAGGWRFLKQWQDVSAKSIVGDGQIKSISEHLSHFCGLLQQLSYAGIVVVGAVQAIAGDTTMGGIIACSILGGRALAPIIAFPNILVQRAHAEAALEGIEQLYKLPVDNDSVDRPLMPQFISGAFYVEQAQYAYKAGPIVLEISHLNIQAGERIAIIGPIGSGKSTLLRLLSGMYSPQKGRVLLDGLDISHISPTILSQQVGFLQQDHRLFVGTLRENLLVGLPDPGDQTLLEVLKNSGLIDLVSKHPRGLELPIYEGGKGLSGGQRQLVAFSRMLLARPCAWLMDEPTASMDSASETKCLQVLSSTLRPSDTLIVVTHKPNLLALVNRIIVVVDRHVVLDGARDAVLARLNGLQTKKPENVAQTKRGMANE